jgi:hypothetical protein
MHSALRWIRAAGAKPVRAGVAAGVLVAVAGATGLAVGAIPDSTGVIHGCYDSGGNLKVIDTAAGQTCAKGYTPLNWSQTGPQGTPGARLAECQIPEFDEVVDLLGDHPGRGNVCHTSAADQGLANVVVGEPAALRNDLPVVEVARRVDRLGDGLGHSVSWFQGEVSAGHRRTPRTTR